MSKLTISATEFKAKCLDLMDRLSSGELSEVTVTKRSRPVALLMPANERRGFYPGFLKDQTLVPDDFDWAAFREESNRLWSREDKCDDEPSTDGRPGVAGE